MIAQQPVPHISVEALHLANNIIAYAAITKVSLLIWSKLEHLAGRAHTLEDNLIGKPSLTHSDDFIHGHRTGRALSADRLEAAERAILDGIRRVRAAATQDQEHAPS